MTEPSSTGIGGDMFCLFYNAKTKKVSALNGSGRAAGNLSLDAIRKDLGLAQGETGGIPMTSAHAVTTPGAAAGWVDTVERFGSGRLTLEQILMPAIELGEKGFPVSELASTFWEACEEPIRKASPNFREILKADPQARDGVRCPLPGELFKNPQLSQTFRTLAKEGKEGFYKGRIAEEIVKVVKDLGGYLSLDDLEYHVEVGSQEVDPISLKIDPGEIAGTKREGGGEVEVWEHPPNGQGIVALMALGILKELSRAGKIPHFSKDQHNSVPYLHAIIESLRIAFADAQWWVTDPDVEKVPSQDLISPAYLTERAKLFDPNKASDILDHGSPAHNHCDTVYLAVTDKEGNGISFINSLYGGFGTGIVPRGCGFPLQNRGSNFSLMPGHPNVIAPRKRPYHTIIPAMITNPQDNNSLHTVYGVMGGFMQPQGHVQVLMNMLAFKATPQSALDARGSVLVLDILSLLIKWIGLYIWKKELEVTFEAMEARFPPYERQKRWKWVAFNVSGFPIHNITPTPSQNTEQGARIAIEHVASDLQLRESGHVSLSSPRDLEGTDLENNLSFPSRQTRHNTG
ncbi:acylase ACY 1 [Coccidioides immitis H538.4]|uniref:Acylase ACY 1 n=1 Tax=Coccidioides immitis H538.4 TaxID=396776 RepID=A0A0J8RUD1_COCIT|nr:acylase ACY 1 [Coccidioides immitis H538.4]